MVIVGNVEQENWARLAERRKQSWGLSVREDGWYGRLHAAGELRIQGVAQAISHKIDGQDGHGDEEPREEDDSEGELDVGASFSHDIPPTGDMWRRPCPEKARIGFDEHRRGADVGSLHDQQVDVASQPPLPSGTCRIRYGVLTVAPNPARRKR
jgi:hypothetical protein